MRLNADKIFKNKYRKYSNGRGITQTEFLDPHLLNDLITLHRWNIADAGNSVKLEKKVFAIFIINKKIL